MSSFSELRKLLAMKYNGRQDEAPVGSHRTTHIIQVDGRPWTTLGEEAAMLRALAEIARRFPKLRGEALKGIEAIMIRNSVPSPEEESALRRASAAAAPREEDGEDDSSTRRLRRIILGF